MACVSYAQCWLACAFEKKKTNDFVSFLQGPPGPVVGLHRLAHYQYLDQVICIFFTSASF